MPLPGLLALEYSVHLPYNERAESLRSRILWRNGLLNQERLNFSSIVFQVLAP